MQTRPLLLQHHSCPMTTLIISCSVFLPTYIPLLFPVLNVESAFVLSPLAKMTGRVYPFDQKITSANTEQSDRPTGCRQWRKRFHEIGVGPSGLSASRTSCRKLSASCCFPFARSPQRIHATSVLRLLVLTSIATAAATITATAITTSDLTTLVNCSKDEWNK